MDLIKRLQVAPLPHMTFLLSSAFTGALGKKSFEQFSAGNEVYGSLYAAGALASAGVAVLAELDALSRARQYKKLRKCFSKGCLSHTSMNNMLTSRCQRDTLTVAAADSGHGDEVRSYIRSKGYRWHHILPDFVLQRPGYVFTKDFWKKSFFVKG